MRNRRLLGVLIACALMAAASAAGAQVITPENMGLNYSLSLGAAFPVNGDAADSAAPILGVSWFGPAGRELGEDAVFGLTVDWTPLSKAGSDDDVNVVPVLFNYGQYGRLAGYRVRTMLGLGVLLADDYIPEMKIDNGVQFGWQIGASVDLSNKLNLGVRFIAGQHPGDDGLVVGQVGFRF